MRHRTRLIALAPSIALAIVGCCRTPIYLEPGGHSTTYRRHLEQYDRGLTNSIDAVSFVESPVPAAREVMSSESGVVPSTVAR